MKYTIITACLNSIDTIEKTVNSILIQKVLPNQYIFVDGGSDDGTIEFIKKFKSQNSSLNILLISQKTKGGIYEAWNMALKKVSSNSEYIFILNSDDWYINDTLSFVKNFFENNSTIDVLCGASLNYYLENKTSRSFNKNFIFFPVLMPIVHPACFIRKSVYDRIGIFNQLYKVSGDYDFLYRCYNSNIKFNFVNRILVKRNMGGFADSNKILARLETLKIGLAHSNFKIFSLLAFLFRIILKK